MTVLALHRARLLETLSEADVEGLASFGETRSFAAGDPVFREHEPADSLYILLEGRLRASMRERGRQVDVPDYGPGDHFTRAVLVEGQLWHVSAVAATAGKVFVLSSMGCAALLGRLAPSVQPLQPVPNITPQPFPAAPALIELSSPRVPSLEVDPSRPPSSGADLGRIRSLSSAVAGVAHEINTPLGVIENAASFVGEQLSAITVDELEVSPEVKETLSDIVVACALIQKNVAHASRLVQSFKKLSVGQLAEPRQQVDLIRLINDVLNVFRAKTLSVIPPGLTYRGPRGQSGLHRLAMSSSRLVISVHSSVPEEQRIWDGFPGLFSRVLLNLLTNIDRYAYASDYPGEVEILLGRERRDPGGPGFTLLVRDFGKGIPPNNLPHVFDPFFTTGRDKGGTGLGLSMVHNLVTQGFDGTVSVSSIVASGTTFELWFPERAPDHAPSVAEPMAAP